MSSLRSLKPRARLMAGCALVVVSAAVMTVRPESPRLRPPAPPSAAAATGLPTPLAAGEIQSVSRTNGGTVIVIKSKQRIPNGEAEAAAGMKASAAREEPARTRTGGHFVAVPDTLAAYTVAHRASDGSLLVEHVQGYDEAVRALKRGATRQEGASR